MILLAEVGTVPLTAIVAAVMSALVSFAVNAYMNRGHNERMVHGQVQKLIEFAMA